MSVFFGDSFDLYASMADAGLGGRWDATSANPGSSLLYAGRFSGSRAWSVSTSTTLQKTSGSNDNNHHIIFAIQQTSTLTGTAAGFYITFVDGSTNQCSVVVRSDGNILLTSGGPTSGTIATYTGALSAASTWTAFEVEVVIHNTAGSIAVRKNGNNSNDFSATSLNTRNGTANAYANVIKVGANGVLTQVVDDFLWRADTSSVAWLGDVRCYRRGPASDSSAAWTRSGSTVPVTPFIQFTTASISNGIARYAPWVAPCSGTVGSATVSIAVGFTGNYKCTIFNDTGSTAPGTVLGSATALSNPTAGTNTFTFSSPPSVVAGTTYWLGFDSDTTTGSALNVAASSGTGTYNQSGVTSSTVYASFPTATPVVSTVANAPIFSVIITPTTASNAMLVNDAVQDGAASYLYDTSVNDADFYALSSISGTPGTIAGIVTSVLALKTDAGTRNVAVQVQSGATLSTGTSTALSTTFGWIVKTDTVDPATSAAWAAAAVSSITFGPKLTA